MTKVSSLPRTGTTDTKGTVDSGTVGVTGGMQVGAFAAKTRSSINVTSESLIVRELTPAPDAGSAAGGQALWALFYAADAVICVVVAAKTSSTVRTVFLVLTAIFALAAVVAVRGLVLHRSRDKRVEEGLPKARQAWNLGYYCSHCDGVFFVASPAGFDLPVRTLMPISDFRHHVWSAGGYGDLA
ncbi:hypothetical protein [Actinoallomurus sp. NPDC050550]|uniref:hypothetical protein n=1 Tax=Actinoallomurus sp. NPDC050550 TaxID=3154937 RepID=UPI00340571F9